MGTVARISSALCVERFQNSFDLPQMAAFVRDEDAERPIYVIAETRVNRRFNFHAINSEAIAQVNSFPQLRLRFQKTAPCRIKILASGHDLRQNLEPNPVRRFKIANK